MSDLVEFLRARLDEDEAAARKAAALCSCHPPAMSWTFRDGNESTDGRILVVDEPHPTLKRKIGRRWNGSYEGLFMAEHIVRHNPARVLAEVAAKRQIIVWHEVASESPELDRDAWQIMRQTLLQLATPYADHPSYDERWRP